MILIMTHIRVILGGQLLWNGFLSGQKKLMVLFFDTLVYGEQLDHYAKKLCSDPINHKWSFKMSDD